MSLSVIKYLYELHIPPIPLDNNILFETYIDNLVKIIDINFIKNPNNISDQDISKLKNHLLKYNIGLYLKTLGKNKESGYAEFNKTTNIPEIYINTDYHNWKNNLIDIILHELIHVHQIFSLKKFNYFNPVDLNRKPDNIEELKYILQDAEISAFAISCVYNLIYTKINVDDYLLYIDRVNQLKNNITINEIKKLKNINNNLSFMLKYICNIKQYINNLDNKKDKKFYNKKYNKLLYLIKKYYLSLIGYINRDFVEKYLK